MRSFLVRAIFSAWTQRCTLAATVSLLACHQPAVWAGPGDVNSINDGQTIAPGTYYNTPGSRTTFINSNGDGIRVNVGDVVRGLESSEAAIPTGNGGTFHIYAPNQLVQINGTVDLSAIYSNGSYQGNGGNLFIDAGIYAQNGSLFGNGINGGNFQFNVGSAMFGPTAQIQALGTGGGTGGNVMVNAAGVVDVAAGAVFNTSGKVLFSYDTNVINIEGGLINLDGVLQANSVVATGDDGHIALVSVEGSEAQRNEQAQADLLAMPSPGDSPGGPYGDDFLVREGFSRGGTIRLVASGQTREDCFSCVIDKALDNGPSILTGQPMRPLLTQAEADTLLARFNALRDAYDGDVHLGESGEVLALGNFFYNGGSVLMAAARDVFNQGAVRANGRNGGFIGVSAMRDIKNPGVLQANSTRINFEEETLPVANGGVIGLGYMGVFDNTQGLVQANGLEGGLILFQGPDNPFGGLVIARYEDGTVVVPNPATLPGAIVRTNNLVQTQSNEVLVHNENLMALNRDPNLGSLRAIFRTPTVRTAATFGDINLRLGGAQWQLQRKGISKFTNFLVSNQHDDALQINQPNFAYREIPIDLSGLNTLTITHAGDLLRDEQPRWVVGRHRFEEDGPWFISPMGGHISLLALGNVEQHDSQFFTNGYLSGGSIHIAAGLDIVNSGGADYQTRVDKADRTGILAIRNGALYGGSIIAKAARNIDHLGRSSMSSNPVIFRSRDIGTPLGSQIGGVVQVYAGNRLTLDFGSTLTAGARILNLSEFDTPLSAQGGVVIAKAGDSILNNGVIRVTGEALTLGETSIEEEESGPSFGLVDDLRTVGLGGTAILYAGSLLENQERSEIKGFASTQGANIFMAAGLIPGTSATPSASGFSLQNGLAGFQPGIAGLSESVIQAGNINTIGRNPLTGDGLGSILFGGNQQVGFAPTATLNNVSASSFADGSLFLAAVGKAQAFTGPDAVARVLCGLPPTLTPPDGPPGGDTPSVTISALNTPLNFDVNGLFQGQRPIPQDPNNVPTNNQPIIALSQPTMFFAKAYTPVTEEILALALEEYNNAVAQGQVPEQAQQEARRYLQQAGVDGDVAQQILAQAATIKIDPIIQGILQAMAGQANSGGVLNQ
jgi:hypothetical protein